MSAYLFEGQRAPFTPRLGETISALSRKLNGRTEMAAYGVVTALSAATNLRKVRVTVDGGRWQPPILMTMAVAPSGIGKSPALWEALQPLVAHEVGREPKFTEAMQRYEADQVSWEREKKRLQKDASKAQLKAEKLSAAAAAPVVDKSNQASDESECVLAAHMAKLPVRPRSTRVLFTNATHAALVDHAALGGPALLVLDDAYGIGRAGVIDGRLGAWYSGLPVSEDTRTHGSVVIPEPRLVVSVAIPESELRRYLRANEGAFRLSGMTGRFLVFRSEADYGRRDLAPATSLDHAAVEAFHRWFAQRLELHAEASGPGEMIDMRLSPQAAWCLGAWQMECEEASRVGGELSDIPDAARKSYDHVVRLAACIEDFETGQLLIGLPATQSAIEIVRLCLRNFDAVMGCDASATILYHRAPRLLKWLLLKVPPGHAFPEKLLRAGCHHETCPKEMWEPVLLALEGQGFVLRRKGSIALNPSYFGLSGTGRHLVNTSAPRIEQPWWKGGTA